jgi:hypothetical protein
MRLSQAQIVAVSTVIVAIVLAVVLAWISMRENRPRPESASESPPETSSLVQATEREALAPQQSAEESQLPPVSLSAARNPTLLPRATNDPHTAAFATESRDPAWSDFTEAQILGEIARLSGLSLITIDVECKTTLCRVQSAFPTTNARARQRLLGVAATLGLEPRPVVAVSNSSGSVVFLAYFARATTPTAESRP